MEDRIVTRLVSVSKPATFKETANAVQRAEAYARVPTGHEDQETSITTYTDYYRKKILERPG